ncbi:MAG TPA: hypothetical protein PLJ79_02010 [Bacteroidia bacterium]|nr:hypothetical protein [Bacteroidia bacterium]
MFLQRHGRLPVLVVGITPDSRREVTFALEFGGFFARSTADFGVGPSAPGGEKNREEKNRNGINAINFSEYAIKIFSSMYS